jgi:Fe-S cluster assembly scaffold protein SufB
MLDALGTVYADAAALVDPQTAHVVVDGGSVVSRRATRGIELRVEEGTRGVSVELVVARGARIGTPIHTCIGFLTPRATQRVRVRLKLEPGASAQVLAHCLFPNVERGAHAMDAEIELERGAELRYNEGHYHGPAGGIVVRPRLAVRAGEGARYFSDFSLTEGRVGRLRLAQRIEAAADSVVEITARVLGGGRDEIGIEDEVLLAGRNARSLVRTRVVLADDARGKVIGITRGQAAGARGHMDCLELVRGCASARAEPIVEVSHPLAKVTHEAAVGTVDQAQLETLMSRGLDLDEAVEVIVTGILQRPAAAARL